MDVPASEIAVEQDAVGLAGSEEDAAEAAAGRPARPDDCAEDGAPVPDDRAPLLQVADGCFDDPSAAAARSSISGPPAPYQWLAALLASAAKEPEPSPRDGDWREDAFLQVRTGKSEASPDSPAAGSPSGKKRARRASCRRSAGRRVSNTLAIISTFQTRSPSSLADKRKAEKDPPPADKPAKTFAAAASQTEPPAPASEASSDRAADSELGDRDPAVDCDTLLGASSSSKVNGSKGAPTRSEGRAELPPADSAARRVSQSQVLASALREELERNGIGPVAAGGDRPRVTTAAVRPLAKAKASSLRRQPPPQRLPPARPVLSPAKPAFFTSAPPPPAPPGSVGARWVSNLIERRVHAADSPALHPGAPVARSATDEAAPRTADKEEVSDALGNALVLLRGRVDELEAECGLGARLGGISGERWAAAAAAAEKAPPADAALLGQLAILGEGHDEAGLGAGSPLVVVLARLARLQCRLLTARPPGPFPGKLSSNPRLETLETPLAPRTQVVIPPAKPTTCTRHTATDPAPVTAELRAAETQTDNPSMNPSAVVVQAPRARCTRGIVPPAAAACTRHTRAAETQTPFPDSPSTDSRSENLASVVQAPRDLYTQKVVSPANPQTPFPDNPSINPRIENLASVVQAPRDVYTQEVVQQTPLPDNPSLSESLALSVVPAPPRDLCTQELVPPAKPATCTRHTATDPPPAAAEPRAAGTQTEPGAPPAESCGDAGAGWADMPTSFGRYVGCTQFDLPDPPPPEKPRAPPPVRRPRRKSEPSRRPADAPPARPLEVKPAPMATDHPPVGRELGAGPRVFRGGGVGVAVQTEGAETRGVAVQATRAAKSKQTGTAASGQMISRAAQCGADFADPSPRPCATNGDGGAAPASHPDGWPKVPSRAPHASREGGRHARGHPSLSALYGMASFTELADVGAAAAPGSFVAAGGPRKPKKESGRPSPRQPACEASGVSARCAKPKPGAASAEPDWEQQQDSNSGCGLPVRCRDAKQLELPRHRPDIGRRPAAAPRSPRAPGDLAGGDRLEARASVHFVASADPEEHATDGAAAAEAADEQEHGAGGIDAEEGLSVRLAKPSRVHRKGGDEDEQEYGGEEPAGRIAFRRAKPSRSRRKEAGSPDEAASLDGKDEPDTSEEGLPARRAKSSRSCQTDESRLWQLDIKFDHASFLSSCRTILTASGRSDQVTELLTRAASLRREAVVDNIALTMNRLRLAKLFTGIVQLQAINDTLPEVKRLNENPSSSPVPDSYYTMVTHQQKRYHIADVNRIKLRVLRDVFGVQKEYIAELLARKEATAADLAEVHRHAKFLVDNDSTAYLPRFTIPKSASQVKKSRTYPIMYTRSARVDALLQDLEQYKNSC
ncbi:hypothetical protein DIPPA_34087 [Diplonema papillatum]|nr:hypothetical protein DIPPA_34087 [Diplonema papillatum]